MANGERGFTLLGVLFLLVLLGVGLAALGKVWETSLRREKEAELLFVGDQFRRAIESYHRLTSGTEKHYPKRLNDLLEDNRFPNTVRHLRRLYRDPFTLSQEWGLIKSGDEITGVYSLAPGKPVKTAAFPPPYEAFADQGSYRDWQFLATPGGVAADPEASGAESSQAAEGDTQSADATQPAQASSHASRIQTCQEARSLAWQACPQNLGAERSACLAEAQKGFIGCMAGR